MAEKTRQELVALMGALLPDNNEELISAGDLREVLTQVILSAYNKPDDQLGSNISVASWNAVIAYQSGFIVAYDDKFWRSLQDDNLNQIPSEGAWWTEVSKATASQNVDLSNYYLKQELATAGQAVVSKTNIGLANVDDTSDADKPISDAAQQALDAKLGTAGGTLTGALVLASDPVADLGAATKQYVDAKAGGGSVRNDYTNNEQALLNPDGTPQILTFDGVAKKAMYRRVYPVAISLGSFYLDLSASALTIVRVECWAVDLLTGLVSAMERKSESSFQDYRYSVVDNVVSGYLYSGTINHSVFVVVEYVKP